MQRENIHCKHDMTWPICQNRLQKSPLEHRSTQAGDISDDNTEANRGSGFANQTGKQSAVAYQAFLSSRMDSQSRSGTLEGRRPVSGATLRNAQFTVSKPRVQSRNQVAVHLRLNNSFTLDSAPKRSHRDGHGDPGSAQQGQEECGLQVRPESAPQLIYSSLPMWQKEYTDVLKAWTYVVC